MTIKIKQYDRQLQELGQTKYPETQALVKVPGVGHLYGSDLRADSGKLGALGAEP
jgi:hypothetical protein